MESKKDIRNSNLLKIMSYICIPIVVVMLVLNIAYFYISQYQTDYITKQNYYETKNFAENYQSQMQTILIDIGNNKLYHGWYNYNMYENEIGEIIYYEYTNPFTFFEYLIINQQTKEVYTNLACTNKTDTIEKIKETLNNNDIHWNYENNTVTTNIENLKTENLPYTSTIYKWLQTVENFSIYTSATTKNVNYFSNKEMSNGKFLYDMTNLINEIPYSITTPVSIILLIASVSFLINALGHKKDYTGVYLNWFDKIPLEIVLIITVLPCIICIQIGIESSYNTVQNMLGIIYAFLVIYIVGTTLLFTIIKRIKAKVFFKNTIIYQLTAKLRKIFQYIYNGFQTNSKMILQFIGISILTVILLLLTGTIYFFNAFWFFVLVGFWIYLLIRVCKIAKQYGYIQNTIKSIYEGKTDIVLEPEQFTGELKQVAIYLNDISGGLSNAIEESLKSERLKTELITNVSHDIKTPLTSIITYIDLLQKEKMDNPKVSEYLRILDYKSQRLKKLTEDLIEASKVSSGTISLQLEKIDIKELIQQALGEFKDKFDEKGLDVFVTTPQVDIYVQADNRYMYRIIENLFSNLYKYTQENTRVYIDITTKNKKVNIQIKNISKEKLNISADELMQRFVRGDRSRTTEGSGLGLSISESLSKLLDGEFKIYIDGDLFKVELVFNVI